MWITTICCHCERPIKVNVPEYLMKRNPHYFMGNSCTDCIPENSPARNGIEESNFDTILVDDTNIQKRGNRK